MRWGWVCAETEIEYNLGFDDDGLILALTWAARYNTGVLIKLTPKGVVFSFLFFFLS